MWDATLYLALPGNASWTEDESALLEKLEQYSERHKRHYTEQALQAVMNRARDDIVSTWAAVLGRRLGRNIEHDSIEQQKELVELLSTTVPLPTDTTTRTSNAIGHRLSHSRR